MAPGLVTETHLYRDLPADIRRQLEQQPSRTVAEGADAAVWLALASEPAGVSGKFYEQRAEQSCQRQPGSAQRIGALRPQPRGPESRLTIRIEMEPDHLFTSEDPDVEERVVNSNAAPLSRAVVAADHEHYIVLELHELVGLDAVALPIGEEPPHETAELLKTVRPYDTLRRVPRVDEIGRQEVHGSAQVPFGPFCVYRL